MAVCVLVCACVCVRVSAFLRKFPSEFECVCMCVPFGVRVFQRVLPVLRVRACVC